MRNRVIYFPFINVPEAAWLGQLLLYWDEVSSIVPYEYRHSPEHFTPFMRELVANELVWQVHPSHHIYQIRGFVPAFTNYIEALGEGIARRAQRFGQGHGVPVHMEKLDQIGRFLVRVGLARRIDFSWYQVEGETAADFMTYLAATLCKLPELAAVPVTDRRENLRRLTQPIRPDSRESELAGIREGLISDILPLPTQLPAPVEIRRFKDRHVNLLGPFRRRVEREVLELAALGDVDLRRRRHALFLEECEDVIAEIGGAMHKKGWAPVLGSIGSIIAEVPGIHPIVGLGSAVWNALAGERRQQPLSDLAYAAYVHGRFGRAT